ADPGFPVRCDVRGDDRAERRLDTASAGIQFAAGYGMTGGAVSGDRKVTAPLDLAERLLVRDGMTCEATEQYQQAGGGAMGHRSSFRTARAGRDSSGNDL